MRVGGYTDNSTSVSFCYCGISPCSLPPPRRRVCSVGVRGMFNLLPGQDAGEDEAGDEDAGGGGDEGGDDVAVLEGNRLLVPQRGERDVLRRVAGGGETGKRA